MRTNSREIDEHLKHVRSIITQFLAKLPITSKDNEEILTVVYSMLNFPREEIDQISEARSKLVPEKPAKKGGFFGGTKNKNKWKDKRRFFLNCETTFLILREQYLNSFIPLRLYGIIHILFT